ncbi:hypothetical protein MATL_G00020060 [Megalops atlanticus]|uniref:Uncharacterized protein n=1 Tax=Megalops atlanticus TaxID=7932 RepID=A0A9D3QLD7_MEGAT|nr:hypothetical protein MATL_G00020060 [Megalops atlanticus]
MDSANASLNHGDKSKDDTSFTSKMHLGSILLLAKQLWGEYSEMLVISLLDEWQPGSIFDSKDMVISTSFKVLMILAFIWRTMCAVTSRKHLLTEKQLAKQISQLIDEKCEALKKLSDLNKKIKEHEKQFKESQELVTSTLCENKDLRECLKQLQRRCKQLTEEKDSLDTTLMMQIKKNQIKTIKQAPEITKQTNQQNERAIQQKLSQEELEWRAQIAKVLEEINGYEQSIKEIKNEQQKTEQQFKNQMKKCEEQYIESRKLVDTLKQLNEERKRHEKEEIAQKVKAFMEEVWLKEVIEGEGWLNNNEKSNQTVKEQKQTLSTSPDLGCISGYQAQD